MRLLLSIGSCKHCSPFIWRTGRRAFWDVCAYQTLHPALSCCRPKHARSL